MIDRIKTLITGEEGFTLIELLVVIIILGILVGIAVPAYLGFAGKARAAAGQANVRSAIPGAVAWYLDGLNNVNVNTYTGLSSANLQLETPGISANVRAGVSTSTNQEYCIQDTEAGGVPYSFTGGTGGAATMIQAPCGAGFTLS